MPEAPEADSLDAPSVPGSRDPSGAECERGSGGSAWARRPAVLGGVQWRLFVPALRNGEYLHITERCHRGSRRKTEQQLEHPTTTKFVGDF